MLPPPVSVEPLDELLAHPLADYWRQRLAQSAHDSYRGRLMVKMPEDLRVYQHIIEETKPAVIVELGTAAGGSAVWFADQMMTLVPREYGGSSVITVDNWDPRQPLDDPAIRFINGNLAHRAVVDEVTREVGGRRAMVVDDSAHTYDVTMLSLTLYSDLVGEGCFFVVEDGIVDEPALCPPDWKQRGVQEATEKFCAGHPEFERHHIAPYGVTSNIGGWLKRHD